MLHSLQIDISRGAALLKILLKHQYLHVVTALYVELPFVLCLCTDTACFTFQSPVWRCKSAPWRNYSYI
jgi:uncharacterized membrane protein